MIRTMDATRLNEIANEPTVRPWLGGSEALDLTNIVENPANYCFLTDEQDGAYVLHNLHPGLYEAHTLALPSARGRPMLRCMRDGFATMFLTTDAIEIVTKVPDGNEAASRWADTAGFRETFRREAFFPLMNELVGASFRSLSYGDWVFRHPENLRIGRAFHAQIEAHVPDNHPDDDTHNYAVGAALCGALAGNVVKSINLYNRWASVAGYGQATIVSVNPPVVDIGTALLELTSGLLSVLKVRDTMQVQVH